MLRHLSLPHGEPQIQQLFAHVRALADSYDDVNFTPPYLSTITADTLIATPGGSRVRS